MKKSFQTIIISTICFSFIFGVSLAFPKIAAAPINSTDVIDVTNRVITVGQPFKKAPYARNVWDMQLFEGKIYLGHGNCQNFEPSPNAGPIPIVYINPSTNKFVTEYTADEEQVNCFKIIDGKLYFPGMDATESWDFGNYYVRENGGWQKMRTIPRGVHVFDLAEFQGCLYAAVNAESNDGKAITVMKSSDNGRTWVSQMPSGKSFITRYNIAFNLFQLNNKLYAIGSYSVYPMFENLLQMDGVKPVTIVEKEKQLFPGAPVLKEFRMLRINYFNSNMVYLGVIADNGFQWRPYGLYATKDLTQARMITLPDKNALPTDILVRENTIYVSAYIKIANGKYVNMVYKSNDLNQWSELFRFNTDTFARSFEEFNSDFYFGLGCDTDILPASTGQILKVPGSAYKY